MKPRQILFVFGLIILTACVQEIKPLETNIQVVGNPLSFHTEFVKGNNSLNITIKQEPSRLRNIRCYNATIGAAQEIYTKRTPQTFLAQKNELFVIHTQKYPNLTLFLLVNDFDFLIKRGNGFVKGGNSRNHDMLITTLRYLNHTIWDFNDTQGTNISIFDNEIYDLKFKSLFVFEDVLVFNLTEIDATSKHYTSSVELRPIEKITRILFIMAISFIVLLFIYYVIERKQKRDKDEKGNNMS